MTLKNFAEQNGIGYNLAKQWKLRGKIVTEGDGYRLVTPARLQHRCVTEGDTATLHNPVTGSTHTISTTRAVPVSLVAASDFDIEKPPRHAPIKRNVAPGRAEAAKHSKGRRLPILIRSSLSAEQEALTTGENLAGKPNSTPLPGLVDVNVPNQWEDVALADCVTALESENDALCRRIESLETANRVLRLQVELFEVGYAVAPKQSAVAGRRSHGTDPEGPMWGA